MPADEEELVMAIEDGVEFAELLAPVKMENGELICRKMQLGDYDASGRRGVVETEEIVKIAADTVIAAVGEKVPGAFYEANGIAVDEKKRPVVDHNTLETSVKGVYVAGDGLFGPATVVEGTEMVRRQQKRSLEGIYLRISSRWLMLRLFTDVKVNCLRRMKNLTAEDVFPATASAKTA